MKRFLAIPLFLSVVFLAGCPPLHETARDGVAASYGFLKDANDHHPACGQIIKGSTATGIPVLTVSICSAINHAADLQVIAVDALEAYCGGPSFDTGGVCEVHAAAADKLKSALADLQRDIVDVKALGR